MGDKCRGALLRVWFADGFAAQVWAGSVAVAGGLFVSAPFSTTTPPFTLLKWVLPEAVWGTLFVLVGLGQITAAFTNSPCVWLASAIAGIMAWAFLAWTTAVSDPRALAMLVYAALALLWCWVLWRVPKRDDTRQSDAVGNITGEGQCV